MKKKPRIFITQGRMPPMECPACGELCTGATGLSSQGPVTPRPGALTLCIFCMAWLVFERRMFPTPTLVMRRAMPDEVDRVELNLRTAVQDAGYQRAARETKH